MPMHSRRELGTDEWVTNAEHEFGGHFPALDNPLYSSSIISTRLYALERIALLAFEFADIREAFLDLGAVHAVKLEPIEEWDKTWIDYYPTLTSRSRRALVSLTDVALRGFFR